MKIIYTLHDDPTNLYLNIPHSYNKDDKKLTLICDDLLTIQQIDTTSLNIVSTEIIIDD